MKIEVVRHYFSENYTIGELYIDGRYFCDTLEPSVDAKEHPAVKVGKYPLNICWSSKFNCYMPKIEVPDRSGILFHVGNYPHDTLGCVLLGFNKIRGQVCTSRVAFHHFCREVFDAVRYNVAQIIVEFKNK